MPVGLYAPDSSVANGVTTVFPYSFKILDQTHLKVSVDSAIKTLGADYTVSGVGASNGGNVTFGVAPINGAVVMRYRDVPYTRTEDYQPNGDFKEETLDKDIDLREMQIQQVAEALTRTLSVSMFDTKPGLLPVAASRANSFLAFDSSGNPIAATGLASVAISGAMVPVVTAATLAAARSAMGLAGIVDTAGSTVLTLSGSGNDSIEIITATGVPTFRVIGSSTNISLYTSTKGSGQWITDADGGFYFRSLTSSATSVTIATSSAHVRSLGLQGAVAGGAPAVTTSAGDLALIPATGIVTVPSGIKFPATQVPSADANTLDDYEEGTYTITMAFGGASVGITYGSQAGTYTKIGRSVNVSGNMTMTSKGSSVGGATLGGLPFASATSAYAVGAAYWANSTTALQCMNLRISSGGVTVAALYGTAGAVTSESALVDTVFSNTTEVDFSLTYNAA